MPRSLPSQPVDAPRAKALPLSVMHVAKSVRVPARRENRALVLVPAMKAERALPEDLAEALDVNVRKARRIIETRPEFEPEPFDLGDLPLLAKMGPGGMRLARRIWAMVEAELRKIEFGGSHI